MVSHSIATLEDLESSYDSQDVITYTVISQTPMKVRESVKGDGMNLSSPIFSIMANTAKLISRKVMRRYLCGRALSTSSQKQNLPGFLAKARGRWSHSTNEQ